jgi:hypothetical protein
VNHGSTVFRGMPGADGGAVVGEEVVQHERVPRLGHLTAGSVPRLPGGGVAGPPGYDPVRGRTGALPPETWIHRPGHRDPAAGR